MTIRPTGNNVVIRRIVPPQVRRLKGVNLPGLWLPARYSRVEGDLGGELWRGVVLAVGPGRRARKTGERIAPSVRAGETVLYKGQYATRVTTKDKSWEVHIVDAEYVEVLEVNK